MKRKMMRMAVLATLLGIVAMEGGLATPAYAEVNINVNIGPPPPIVVAEPPTMLFLGEPGLYVAVGVPYDVYFLSGRYYYYHGSNWFWAPGYGGPWVHVVHKSLPPGLQRYKVVQLRDFREREYRIYKVQGPKFKGKKFDADPGPNGKAQRVSSNGGGNSHNGGGNSQGGGGNSQGGSGNSQGGGNGKGGGRGKGH